MKIDIKDKNKMDNNNQDIVYTKLDNIKNNFDDIKNQFDDFDHDLELSEYQDQFNNIIDNLDDIQIKSKLLIDKIYVLKDNLKSSNVLYQIDQYIDDIKEYLINNKSRFFKHLSDHFDYNDLFDIQDQFKDFIDLISS